MTIGKQVSQWVETQDGEFSYVEVAKGLGLQNVKEKSISDALRRMEIRKTIYRVYKGGGLPIYYRYHKNGDPYIETGYSLQAIMIIVWGIRANGPFELPTTLAGDKNGFHKFMGRDNTISITDSVRILRGDDILYKVDDKKHNPKYMVKVEGISTKTMEVIWSMEQRLKKQEPIVPTTEEVFKEGITTLTHKPDYTVTQQDDPAPGKDLFINIVNTNGNIEELKCHTIPSKDTNVDSANPTEVFKESITLIKDNQEQKEAKVIVEKIFKDNITPKVSEQLFDKLMDVTDRFIKWEIVSPLQKQIDKHLLEIKHKDIALNEAKYLHDTLRGAYDDASKEVVRLNNEVKTKDNQLKESYNNACEQVKNMTNKNIESTPDKLALRSKDIEIERLRKCVSILSGTIGLDLECVMLPGDLYRTINKEAQTNNKSIDNFYKQLLEEHIFLSHSSYRR